MASNLSILILIWKNFKLQFHYKWITAVELLIPIILMLLLVLTSIFLYTIKSKEIETLFEAYDINSLPVEIYNPSEVNKLYYAPKSSFIDELMEGVETYLNVTVSGFETEDELESSYLNSSNVIAGVVFNENLKNGTQENMTIEYTIRPKSIIGVSWNLSYAMTDFPLMEITDTSMYGTIYASTGFLSIQHAVAKTIIEKFITGVEGTFDDIFNVEMSRKPFPPYSLDTFYKLSDYYVAIAIIVCYLFPSAIIVRNLVRERQTKLRQTLLLMGLSNLENWIAWFVKEFIFLLFSNILMTLFLCVRFRGPAVLNHSDAGVILFWLCLYSADIIVFAFFISTFLDKENTAVATMCIIFIVEFVPYLHSRGLIHQLPFGARLVLCLLPNTLFAYSVRILIKLELLGIGFKWRSFGENVFVHLDINLDSAFMMLVINIIVYLILTWYIDAKRQNHQPWYFPFMASYWTGEKNIPEYLPDSKDHDKEPTFYEGDILGVKPMIHLKNLTKKYSENSAPIVDNITLKAYKGQITALLAHNCSGKSTLISMLYGAKIPSSGSIIIKSLDLCNVDEARNIIPLLGICPEYDTAIRELTVKENLQFFCHMKGFDFDVLKSEINEILALLDLEIMKNMLVKTLSDSSRRRLSVGIALLGQSEVVFLDEPTMNMDSVSRRITWDALVLEKKQRAIFFTTSHIKEADSFADRIAVFHDGQIKCCGCPTFLKKTYDAGYILTLFKEPNFNLVRVKSYISSRLPAVTILSETEEEVKLKLPSDCCHLYENLLKAFEDQELKIKQMVISETSLDQLFEKITTTTTASNEENFDSNKSKYSTFDSLSRKRNGGCSLFNQHVKALIKKKFIFSKYNKVLTLSQIILLPLVLIFSNLMKESDLSEDYKLEDNEPFDLGAFGKTHVVYGIDPNSNITIELADTYASLLEGSQHMHLVDLDEENYLTYLISQGKKNEKLYKSKFIIGAAFEEDYNSTLITAFYNCDAYHSSVISLLFIHNTILEMYSKGGQKFHVINKPLPVEATERSIETFVGFLGSQVSYFLAQDLTFGMAILMSSFVILLVAEINIDFKKQQFISGLNSFVYWFSTFLYDFAIYLIPCIMVLLIFFLFQTECLHELKEIGSLALLLLLHGLSSIFLIYCCSTFSHSTSVAYIGIFLYYLLGLFFVFVVSMYESDFNYHKSETLNILFTALMPSYCVGRGIYSIHRNCMISTICNNKKVQDLCLYGNISSPVAFFCCSDQCGDTCFYWSLSHLSLSIAGIGKQLIALACQPIIFIILLTILELEIFQKMRITLRDRKKLKYFSDNTTDKDVLDEAQQMLSSPVSQLEDENYYLIFKNVLKFQPYLAIGRFSFGVKKGECFGIIGIDNSGKSTVLQMICAAIPSTTGNIFVNGFNIRQYPHKVMDKIGFSFGNYSLLRQFTIKENLMLFAQIRGIPEAEISSYIESLTCVLSLPPHLKVKHCNEIIRSKLSVAIAIIGLPPLILLEEPTAAMAPVACAETREAIKLAKNVGCTIVLATQKMDDCCALCDRIGILVKGKLNYIGDFEHLREAYKDGITVILHMRRDRISRARYTRQAITVKGHLEEMKAYIEDAFPTAIPKIQISTYLNYFIPLADVTWSRLFHILENMKGKRLITTYSVCETNFDHIFSYNIASVEYVKEKKITDFLKERKKVMI